MRSQTSELGHRICSPEMLIPDAQGLSNHESSIPGGAKEASRRGTGGVDDCGTAEEDGPVTWETPDRPVARSGLWRTGDPLQRAVGSKRPDGRPHDGKSWRTEPTLARLVRHDRGKTGGVLKRHGESDGCIGAKMVGNGFGTWTQRSKGGQC